LEKRVTRNHCDVEERRSKGTTPAPESTKQRTSKRNRPPGGDQEKKKSALVIHKKREWKELVGKAAEGGTAPREGGRV